MQMGRGKARGSIKSITVAHNYCASSTQSAEEKHNSDCLCSKSTLDQVAFLMSEHPMHSGSTVQSLNNFFVYDLWGEGGRGPPESVTGKSVFSASSTKIRPSLKLDVTLSSIIL